MFLLDIYYYKTKTKMIGFIVFIGFLCVIIQLGIITREMIKINEQHEYGRMVKYGICDSYSDGVFWRDRA